MMNDYGDKSQLLEKKNNLNFSCKFRETTIIVVYTV
jgi:hypothetical protein